MTKTSLPTEMKRVDRCISRGYSAVHTPFTSSNAKQERPRTNFSVFVFVFVFDFSQFISPFNCAAFVLFFCFSKKKSSMQ